MRTISIRIPPTEVPDDDLQEIFEKVVHGLNAGCYVKLTAILVVEKK